MVAEDPPEVANIGKHLVLHGQERPTGIDQVDARQVVFVRNGLSANVLLDRHRVVGPALHRGIVGDEEALTAVDHPEAGDDAGRMGSSVVEVVGSQRRKFEKGRSGVHDALDAFPSEVFTAGPMSLNVFPPAALRSGVQPFTQLRKQPEVVRFSGSKVRVGSIDSGRQSVHAEPSAQPRQGLHLIPFKPRIGAQTPSINRPMSRSPGAKPTMSTASTMRRRKCCCRCSTRI